MTAALTAAAGAGPIAASHAIAASPYLPSSLPLPAGARPDIAYLWQRVLAAALVTSQPGYTIPGDTYEVLDAVQASYTSDATAGSRNAYLEIRTANGVLVANMGQFVDITASLAVPMLWSRQYASPSSWGIRFAVSPIVPIVLQPGWTVKLIGINTTVADQWSSSTWSSVRIPTGPALVVEPVAPTPLFA